jgi:hypothetical protein
MLRKLAGAVCLAAFLPVLPSAPAAAQVRTPPPPAAAAPVRADTSAAPRATAMPRRTAADSAAPLVPVGGWEEDRMRLDQLLGGAPTAGWLLRTPSALVPPAPDGGWRRVRGYGPRVRLVHNTELPYALNQGSLWAGQGTSMEVMGGGRVDAGRFTVILAPRITHSANGDFQFIRYTRDTLRSAFASPWHFGTESADLPLRFGRHGMARLSLGESSVRVRTGPAAVGASTETQWWGPGIRNALVLSSNAPAFAHLFARTARPLRTVLGDVEGTWIVGWLGESDYFDGDRENDGRTIGALAVTLQPRGAPGLTLGAARAVYGAGSSPLRALDVFRGVGHPDVAPPNDTADFAVRGRDQVASVFGRWVLPASGMEVYGELARIDLPSSPRDLLTAPARTGGYTLGVQWARETGAGSVVRLQAEATDLEQTDRNGVHTVSFYTSRVVPQGYTNGGRVIGAAIGPGASGQFAAADYLRPHWHGGLYLQRIRYENDYLYRIRTATSLQHDVGVVLGARGGGRVGPVLLEGEGTLGRRLNYLFQSESTVFTDLRTIDLSNRTLSLTARWAPR